MRYQSVVIVQYSKDTHYIFPHTVDVQSLQVKAQISLRILLPFATGDDSTSTCYNKCGEAGLDCQSRKFKQGKVVHFGFTDKGEGMHLY